MTQKVEVLLAVLLQFSATGGDPGADPTLIIGSDSYFYEDNSTLTQDEVSQIINWIKTDATEIRVPFCSKKKHGRGVGMAISRVVPLLRHRLVHFATLIAPLGTLGMALTLIKIASLVGRTLVYNNFAEMAIPEIVSMLNEKFAPPTPNM